MTQFFKIASRFSPHGEEFVVDVPGFSTGSDNLQVFPFNGGENQQWYKASFSVWGLSETVSLISRSSGQAIHAMHSGAVIQSPLANPPRVDDFSNVWKITEEEGGVKSIMFLEYDSHGHANHLALSVGNNKALQILQPSGNVNQRWLVVPVQDIAMFVIESRDSRCVLDVPGFISVDTEIQQYSYNGNTNQLWQLLRPDGNPADPFAIYAGEILIIKSVCSGKVLEIGQSHIYDKGTHLRQAPLTKSPNQQWRLLDAPNGSVVLQNVASQMVLDIPDRKKYPGVIIQQSDYNNQGNQHWWFKQASRLFDPNAFVH